MATYQVWAKETVYYYQEVEAENLDIARHKAECIIDWGEPVDGEDFDIDTVEEM